MRRFAEQYVFFAFCGIGNRAVMIACILQRLRRPFQRIDQCSTLIEIWHFAHPFPEVALYRSRVNLEPLCSQQRGCLKRTRLLE